MKKEALKMNIKGIKCDNISCDFKDMSVKFEDYDKWLNKPCPLCGCNLLTKEDYNKCKTIMKAAKLLNNLIKVPKNYNGEDDLKANFTFEKDGTLLSKITPAENFVAKEKNADIIKDMNKSNSKWLKYQLINARKQNKVKNMEDLDVEILKYLIYGYDFTDDDLSYIFNISKQKVTEIKNKNNISSLSSYYILFKSKNNLIYDVDIIYNSCIL